ncbi:hypothetical protein AVEN_213071-1 [Araneus ventricosus]|uniref:Uncharacterized protein n=1 Tax=Araneus ventricosus TaxID=182803 RepID=A0A4Y2T906_ARAVE|nr:hypothetical protein AVEN_213071-1 [Araneus ventricosus]
MIKFKSKPPMLLKVPLPAKLQSWALKAAMRAPMQLAESFTVVWHGSRWVPRGKGIIPRSSKYASSHPSERKEFTIPLPPPRNSV